ncbi:MAG: hypothetical protein COC24_010260 [Alphaproteobacteria bacterium]|nr:hypothetical protein [Alphaproteobacteria bacterium]
MLSIENVIGSRYGDVIKGDSKNNILWSYDGDDTLDGGSGNDSAVSANSTTSCEVLCLIVSFLIETVQNSVSAKLYV